MLNDINNPRQGVIHAVATVAVPATPVASLHPSHQAWIDRQLSCGRGFAAVDVDDLAGSHPALGRVVAFAAARLEVLPEIVRLTGHWADAADEVGALELAEKILGSGRPRTVGFSGNSAGFRMVLARLERHGIHLPDASGLLDLHLDLADKLTLNGAFSAMPMTLAVASLGLPMHHAWLSPEEIRTAWENGETEALQEEVRGRVQDVAALFTRLVCGPQIPLVGNMFDAPISSDFEAVDARPAA